MYGLDRWSEDMLPHIKLEMWAKSSQWLVLSRRLARVVDADSLVIELFAKHCLPGRRCVGDVSHHLLLLSCESLSVSIFCIEISAFVVLQCFLKCTVRRSAKAELHH